MTDSTSQVQVHNFSVSLDGFATGEGQSFETPFGHAGTRLTEWAFATRTFQRMFGRPSGGGVGVDEAFASSWDRGIGAEIMGRRKFGPQQGPWENLEWKGWWGEEPPFHTPVFVLTHHVRPSIVMGGGTTFHFLDADLVDHVHVVVVPILLGRGVRLWDGQEGLEDRFTVEATSSPSGVTPLVLSRR